MRNRLIMASVWMLAVSLGNAAVIDFSSPSDLAGFNQATPNFWAVSSGAGLGGTPALTGSNDGKPGWVTYTTGFDSKSTSASGGIYFKLASTDITSSGFALLFGVSSSTNYTPNLSTVADASKDHYSAALQYSNSPATRQFRVAAQQSNNGTLVVNQSSYYSLAYDSWYYLSLESTFDPTTSRYSINVNLYSSSDAGVLGASIMSASLGSFVLPDLTDATQNYFFFGLDGRAATRGIMALDNFTYDAVPEPSLAGLAIVSGFCLLGARRFLKK